MSLPFFRILLVLMLCILARSSYADDQSDLVRINTLIDQGNSASFIGHFPQAVASYRKALMLELSASSVDDNQLLNTFNKYGESYSHIGMFSIVADQAEDEALLKLLVQHAVAENNLKLARMVHGLLLMFGEKKFGDPSKGILYSYLRADPLKPTCQLEKPLPQINKLDELSSLEACQQRYAFVQLITQATTPELKAYRAFEEDFFDRAIRPALNP